MLIHALTSYDDESLATKCMNALSEKELAFVDCRGNNLLWYLTYRDDQNAAGGFACPKTVAALLERGVDPNRRNNQPWPLLERCRPACGLAGGVISRTESLCAR